MSAQESEGDKQGKAKAMNQKKNAKLSQALRSDEEDTELNDGEDEVDRAEGMEEARIPRKKGTGPNDGAGDGKLGGARRGDGLTSNSQKKLEDEKKTR